MYKKILLATDGSDHAKRAAENAIHITTCSEGAEITIVYAVAPDKAKSDVLANWNASEINDVRRERVSDVENKAREAGVKYEVKILHGEPGPTIVDYANKNTFDIVVIGSRGLNGLQELVLGSVSHKVAKRANCPVLIVK
ncbi:universal stress protein [Lottiidibacillus patelloidae]|uniref:Universal stress protein n=1 Tax=Lottiidibacillus patelloidae TaxID=2670334 RepID=A0A263BXP4_9BACI|nr:universal stress protein [Lottiidibacillus patelloidae]OZM58077.1 universal stress protein [Lottiidibacillus patelloidae]